MDEKKNHGKDKSPFVPFDMLDPELVLESVEEGYGLELESTLYSCASYVNRVFGLRDVGGKEYIAKFYRPQRWSYAQILEEHRFVQTLAQHEVPVVCPFPNQEGDTLQTLIIEENGKPDQEMYFALYPKLKGFPFDPEGEKDYVRMGALLGHLHVVGSQFSLAERGRFPPLAPLELLAYFTETFEIEEEIQNNLREVAARLDAALSPIVSGYAPITLHGDFHRGNLIDCGEQGLFVIDFDDMIAGPPLQDLWVLLPDHASRCPQELRHILKGYREFYQIELADPCHLEVFRLYRMFHYLYWQAQQRYDRAFYHHYPEWGTKKFWERTVADLLDQAEYLACV
ncbi:serine/threonine protein kinase [Treponema sp. J25]|uniref:serine/threonine protein kinase n=1 Tax=Treponema sp. J25 TaxID=2094121 RepID=UPI0014050FBA|nr:serine/threonine protein kinase [Treponema sp. J25]